MNGLEEVKTDKPTRKEKGQAKSRLKNMLMFLPNMVKLLGNLLIDGRVPAVDKALFAAAIVYVIMPLDFIPDIFPFFKCLLIKIYNSILDFYYMINVNVLKGE